ncbi:MAG: cbb3-type cytochrome c oxidase N-terminal domain-containing protein [Thermodesulfobacteriota bacterium]
MEEKDELGYQGKVFPRWLSVLWIAVFLWAIIYWVLYAFPDLLHWLSSPPLK